MKLFSLSSEAKFIEERCVVSAFVSDVCTGRRAFSSYFDNDVRWLSNLAAELCFDSVFIK